MKKIKLTILSAFVMSSMFYASGSQAQTNPCGWGLLNQVCFEKCFEQCDGTILVTPDINLPNVVYSWSNGSTSSSLQNLCAGDYTVTVTDGDGCSQQFTYTVEGPDLLEVTCLTISNESAPGAADGSIEASVSGGWGPFEFVWQTNPVQYGALINNLTAGSYTVVVYDEKKCVASTTCEVTTDEKVDCDGFRTQTQGGWGQCNQSGNNPGTYLAANFDGAFPADLTIGCNRTLTLTSASAVCDFLPSGTSPKVLPVGALVDPGSTYKNVFAGQLVAATLNVQFDLYDVDFGAPAINLGDLEIAAGPFAGWSVNDLLAEANRKIGGCASVYSNSELSSALDYINNNFTDGTADNGYLVCPEKKDDRISFQSGNVNISVYPNPVSGNANISVVAAKDEVLEIDLYNIAGQKSASLFKGQVKAQEMINVNLDAASMDSGIYFIKVISSEKVFTQKIIIKK